MTGGKSRLLLEIWEKLVGQLESRGWFLEEIPLLRELSFYLITLSGLATPPPIISPFTAVSGQLGPGIVYSNTI